MSDTPESVKELIGGYCGYRGAIDWGPMIDMLTRYADLLEQGNARIRELEADLSDAREFNRDYLRLYDAALQKASGLEAQITAHEAVCAGVWVPVGERLPVRSVQTYHGDNRFCYSNWVDRHGNWHVPGATHWLDAREPK